MSILARYGTDYDAYCATGSCGSGDGAIGLLAFVLIAGGLLLKWMDRER